jgi:hypothetical protein
MTVRDVTVNVHYAFCDVESFALDQRRLEAGWGLKVSWRKDTWWKKEIEIDCHFQMVHICPTPTMKHADLKTPDRY